MKKPCRIVLSLAFLILSQLPIPIASHAQPPEKDLQPVTAVRVKDNKVISTETILSKIRTKTGDRFSQEALADDLKRLYATEYFTNVSIDVEDYEGGVAVTFIVEEKAIIEDIVFKGNRAFRAQKLKSAMKSKPNEMLNPALLAQDMTEIKALYIKKGYPLVDVEYQ
ncbi:MAG: hypothetical protein HZA30_01230, partial [Candidatus Omnitrophica bacterium]|nr:hypothetical protein [Candidatus Omnitrophota bacterium]